MRVTLKQLRYAVALAESLHFRRAAEACNVSQPALTAQIQALEEALGVQLFERTRRKVLLTPSGEALVPQARRVLEQVEEIETAARRSGRRLSGRLRLGVIPTIGPYLLPELLPRVRARFPELQLYLREDRTPRLLETLAAGRLDLLLLALPVEGADLDCMPLFDEPFLLAAPSSHRLAGQRRVREADLAGESVLLLEEEHCLREQALSVCRLAGASEAMGLQATSLNTLVQMVAGGLGVTLLPAMTVPVEVRPEAGLSVLPFAPPAPGRTIGLVWRRSSARAEDFREFGALLAEGGGPAAA